MNPKLLLGLALVLCFLAAGCETEKVQKSQFTVTNLNGDGSVETVTNSFPFECGKYLDGKILMAFPLSTSSWSVVLFYPTNKLNQVAHWQTGSPEVAAWLTFSRLDGSTLANIKSAAALPPPKSEPLHGSIEAGEFDWRHQNRHYLAFDLAGDNGLAVKGEMNAYDKTHFDAKQLWLDPYLVIVGPFVAW